MDGAIAPADVAAAAGAIRPDRKPLLAFMADAESEQTLREALLEVAADGAEIRRGDILAATRALQKMPTPLVLVVDVTGHDNPMSALDALAQVVEPDVRVLVVGDRQDVNFYRQLTRGLGILEYLYKPLTREMVARHFGPLVTRGQAQDLTVRGGRVITVTGVRGGVGASTIAANLAWHLAHAARRHTVLLDADLHTGTAALMVAGKSGAGLRTALESPDRVDELFVERSAQPVTDRLAVLAAEENLTERPRTGAGAPHRLLEMLRRRYNFIVADAPYNHGALPRELLDMAHQRVLVMDPTLAAARDMLRFLALPNAPQQSRRALVVLNHAGRPGAMTRKEVEEALQLQPDLMLPHLPRLLPASANLGEPPVTQRGPLRSTIAALAHEVASVRTIDPPVKRRWFGLRRG